jgi:ribosomal protein S6--L-glutamate ligase
VNASPGLEGIEAATGVDVAGSIIQLLETQASGATTSKTRRRTKRVD